MVSIASDRLSFLCTHLYNWATRTPIGTKPLIFTFSGKSINHYVPYAPNIGLKHVKKSSAMNIMEEFYVRAIHKNLAVKFFNFSHSPFIKMTHWGSERTVGVICSF